MVDQSAQVASASELGDLTIVALYDQDSGAIVHMHVATVFKGGRAVGEEEARRSAEEEARRLGHDVARLKFKMSKNHQHAARAHRINPKTGEFEALPPVELKIQGSRN